MHFESELRRADYAYRNTVVVDGGEVDMFTAGQGLPVIAVRLESDASGEMTLTGAEFMAAEGGGLDVVSDDGAALSAEMLDALANELIEHDLARGLEYAYGRSRSLDSDGNPVPAGGVTDRSVLDDEIIAKYEENSGFPSP